MGEKRFFTFSALTLTFDHLKVAPQVTLVSYSVFKVLEYLTGNLLRLATVGTVYVSEYNNNSSPAAA